MWPLVDIWIGVNEQGHGSVALTRADAITAAGPQRVAVAHVSAWAIVGVMWRASRRGTVPFTLEPGSGLPARPSTTLRQPFDKGSGLRAQEDG
jgi:hypothetical protein